MSAANTGKNRSSKTNAVLGFTSRGASSSKTLPTLTLSHAFVSYYGVGAGDSAAGDTAGDGEGAGLFLCTAPPVVL